MPTIDLITGSCKGYLISLIDQVVRIGNKDSFEKVSPKYTTREIDQMAVKAGFKTTAHFYDSKAWFVDTLWEAV